MSETRYNLGKGSKKVYKSGLHLDLKHIIGEMLDVSPMDFTLVSGVRQAAEQWKLFVIGRRPKTAGLAANASDWEKIPKGEPGFGTVTNCDGYEYKSKHQLADDGFGHAFDFQCHIPGRPSLSYDKIHMAVLVGAFLTTANALFEHGIITHLLKSGADWDSDTQYLEPGTFHDMPHLQLYKP
jgi:hypothetical protein